MAEKKLLNFTFTTRTTGASINLGCNSSNNITAGKKTFTRYISKSSPLGQVGCLIYNAHPDYYEEGGVQNLYVALKKAGYGNRLVVPSNKLDAEAQPKYYLNIAGYDYFTDDTLPYITMGKQDGPILNFKGKQYPIMTISYGYPAFIALCGKIYDDGTFTGDVAHIFKHWTVDNILVSKNVYEWSFDNNVSWENYQLINKSVIEILNEFIPVDPEGEYIDDGYGDFNSNSDPVDIPDLPTASALATGMLKIYQMSNSDLTSLSDYLWSELFDVDTFKKMFNDPMQAILNLSFSPLSVETGTKSAIKIGNITTSVTGTVCTSQYQKIDFGTIHLNEYWANFADYSPYTRLSIYLPYVGTQTISIDDVMNGSIQLVGFGDVLTGSLVYVLYSAQTNRAGHGHSSVLYSWGGNCQYQIPLTANNMANVISSLLGVTSSVAGGIAATVATGGITAPIVASALSGTISNTLNAKQQTQRSGGVGGSTGVFGVQKPYLILERPETKTIDRYSEFIGEPTEASGILGSFSGYVKVKSVHVGNVGNASDSEKNDIERILKEGVVI